jgi:uncharacterized protein YjbI with pentapeptide repeats
MAEITREELLARYAAGERDFSGLLNSIDLSGANLSEANLSGSKDIIINKTILLRANLQDSFIEGILDSDLRRANLDRINMLEGPIKNCNMEGVSLKNANLSEVGIRSTNLRSANLEGTKGNFYMKDVDLTGAIGFDRQGVWAGYWQLTLPDGTVVADWEAQ